MYVRVSAFVCSGERRKRQRERVAFVAVYKSCMEGILCRLVSCSLSLSLILCVCVCVCVCVYVNVWRETQRERERERERGRDTERDNGGVPMCIIPVCLNQLMPIT